MISVTLILNNIITSYHIPLGLIQGFRHVYDFELKKKSNFIKHLTFDTPYFDTGLVSIAISLISCNFMFFLTWIYLCTNVNPSLAPEPNYVDHIKEIIWKKKYSRAVEWWKKGEKSTIKILRRHFHNGLALLFKSYHECV